MGTTSRSLWRHPFVAPVIFVVHLNTRRRKKNTDGFTNGLSVAGMGFQQSRGTLDRPKNRTLSCRLRRDADSQHCNRFVFSPRAGGRTSDASLCLGPGCYRLHDGRGYFTPLAYDLNIFHDGARNAGARRRLCTLT